MATIPISDGDPKNTYTATGGQTTFAYTFWVKDEDHIAVYVNGTLQTITTDYTVSAIESVTGANIVFNSGLTLNDAVVIIYDPLMERTAEYTGTIRLDALNTELTYILTLIQSNQRKIDDALRPSDTETVSFDGTLPALTGNGGLTLALKSDLSGLEFASVGTLALADGDVTTAKIAALAVTTAKIALDAIDGTLIADNAIDSEHYTDGSIDNEHLADNAVDLDEMAHGTQGDILYYGASGVPTRLGAGTSGQVLETQGAGANPQWATAGAGGILLQQVNDLDGAVATGTTVLPDDDTIPQNTEGDEYMSVSITPSNSSNRLIIIATGQMASTNSGVHSMALFQDSTANALASSQTSLLTNNFITEQVIHHEMAAGTTSATTFKIRMGNNAAGTTTFNGVSGARKLGGSMGSSLIVLEMSS